MRPLRPEQDFGGLWINDLRRKWLKYKGSMFRVIPRYDSFCRTVAGQTENYGIAGMRRPIFAGRIAGQENATTGARSVDP